MLAGEAKTGPATAAESMPGPTQPACDGSWPLPPPEMMLTLFLSSDERTITLYPSNFCSPACE